MKAHQGIGAIQDPAARWRAVGNDHADRAAKAAVLRHDQPSASQEAQVKFWSRRTPHIVRAVAIAMAEFPPAGGKLPKKPTRPRGDATDTEHKEQQHEWHYVEGRWRCVHCWTYAQGDRGPPGNGHGQKCDRKRITRELGALAAKGHAMMFATASLPFAFCAKCGGWTARRTYRLAKACQPPTAAGRQALARIARGEHPWRAKDRRSGREKPRGRVSSTRAARGGKAADGSRSDDAPGRDGLRRKRVRRPEQAEPVGADKRQRREGGGDHGDADLQRQMHVCPSSESAGEHTSGESVKVNGDVAVRLDPGGGVGAEEMRTREEATAEAHDRQLEGTSMNMIVTVLRGLAANASGADAVTIFNGYSGTFQKVTVAAVERARDRLRSSGRRDDDHRCIGPGDGDTVSPASRGEPVRDDGGPRAASSCSDQGSGLEVARTPTFTSRQAMLQSLGMAATTTRVAPEEVPRSKRRRLDCEETTEDRVGEGTHCGDNAGSELPRPGEQMVRGCPHKVRARVAQASRKLSTTREGPGDPPESHGAAALTTSCWTSVDAVVGKGAVAIRTIGDDAREAAEAAERGEATHGPPSGCAAPLDDLDTTAGRPSGRDHTSSPRMPRVASGVRPHARQGVKPSLNLPPNLGARPSNEGDALYADRGTPPPEV